MKSIFLLAKDGVNDIPILDTVDVHIIVGEIPAVFQRFTGKTQSLHIGLNALFIQNLDFQFIDSIAWLKVYRYRLSGQRLHKNLISWIAMFSDLRI